MRFPRVICVLLLLGAAPQPGSAEVLDGIAAVVGDEVILRSELDAHTDGAMAEIRRRGQALTRDELRELRDQALNSLIDDVLVLQVARTNNMIATDAEVDTAIAGIARDEGVEPEQIYQAAAAQGLPREAYREQLGKQISRMKLMSSTVQQRVSVSDAEVRELYARRFTNARAGTRIRVLHILAPAPPDAKPELEAQMTAAFEKLRTVAVETGDFANLAAQHSRAPTAAQGGMTVLVEADTPKEILAALEGLEPGAISAVVRTSHGFNLFQFLERFDPTKVEFGEVEANLRSELIERKTMPEFRNWLDELRESRYIEVVHPDLQ